MLPKDPPLTREVVATLVSYNPETGDVRWLVSQGRAIAGRLAGHLEKRTGYRRIPIGDKLVMASRIAWLLHYGEWPTAFIDHIDGDKANNRISNLRRATKSQNTMNIGPRRDNSTGHRGVYLVRGRRGFQKYAVQYIKDGKKITKRCYTLEEAIEARAKHAARAYGEFFKE